ncbi:MAG TPA: hypothetical protein VH639_29450, partial [Bryobacteraceae bacterium]
NELNTLVHDSVFLPRHLAVLGSQNLICNKLSPMSSDQSVTHVSGLYPTGACPRPYGRAGCERWNTVVPTFSPAREGGGKLTDGLRTDDPATPPAFSFSRDCDIIPPAQLRAWRL